MPASCSSLGKSCSSIPLCLCTGSSSFRFLENLCSLSLSAQLQQILLKGEHSHQYRREIIPKHPDHIRDPFPQCQKMSDPYHHLLFTPLFFFFFVIPSLLICHWTMSFLEIEVRPYFSQCHSRNSIMPVGWVDRSMDIFMSSFQNNRSKAHRFSSQNNNRIRPNKSPFSLWNILAIATKKPKMVGIDL